jgi:trans-aconitate 2-methyltransferase
MTDWSGRDYADVSGLQRAMITEALGRLDLADDERVLDIGCGDGFLTRAAAAQVPHGYAVGADASPRMIATARAAVEPGVSGPWFLVADARRLPFGRCFDVVVSFNALHWVPEQGEALSQIAAVLEPGGRAVIQAVCAGERTSLEAAAMTLTRAAQWAPRFEGYTAPFVHVDPLSYGDLAATAGLTLEHLTVTDREWDFGSRELFERWCTVGTGAWTDRLPVSERAEFVAALVDDYESIAGQPGLFRYTQMRAELRR